mmetsp:Transcript_3711/g.10878  ORF Transcript_3711/g.10878 Transcript_3711/m.10878 type:complete len:229 (+) Transcript_3711:157-843(+)
MPLGEKNIAEQARRRVCTVKWRFSGSGPYCDHRTVTCQSLLQHPSQMFRPNLRHQCRPCRGHQNFPGLHVDPDAHPWASFPVAFGNRRRSPAPRGAWASEAKRCRSSEGRMGAARRRVGSFRQVQTADWVHHWRLVQPRMNQSPRSNPPRPGLRGRADQERRRQPRQARLHHSTGAETGLTGPPGGCPVLEQRLCCRLAGPTAPKLPTGILELSRAGRQFQHRLCGVS